MTTTKTSPIRKLHHQLMGEMMYWIILFSLLIITMLLYLVRLFLSCFLCSFCYSWYSWGQQQIGYFPYSIPAEIPCDICDGPSLTLRFPILGQALPLQQHCCIWWLQCILLLFCSSHCQRYRWFDGTMIWCQNIT